MKPSNKFPIILCIIACLLTVSSFICSSTLTHKQLWGYIELRSLAIGLGFFVNLCVVVLFGYNIKLVKRSAAITAFVLGLVSTLLMLAQDIFWAVGYTQHLYNTAPYWIFTVLPYVGAFITQLYAVSIAFFAESQIRNKKILAASIVAIILVIVDYIVNYILNTIVYEYFDGEADALNKFYIINHFVCWTLPITLLFAAAATINSKNSLNKA